MKVYIGPWPDYKPSWKNLWGLWPRGDRKIRVKTHPWDSWSSDHTLAYVIAPLLRDLRGAQSIPYTDPSDGPPEYATDGEHSEARWNWILEEMIWTFETYTTDWESQFYSGQADYEFVEIPNTANKKLGPYYQVVDGKKHTLVFDEKGYKAHKDRMERGTYLFGKYYSSLWR